MKGTEKMKFTEFNFKPYIQEALKEINFREATEVQEKLIPIVLAGNDLVGESKTGSGKTHTFLLPIFQTLNEDSQQVEAVITAPSRELATQIYQAARQIASHSEKEIRIVNYVGGTDKSRQIEKLQVKQPHIVIGTPGRIYDLVASGDLAIHKAHTFVVDEADMTLDMGFLSTVATKGRDKNEQIYQLTKTLQPYLAMIFVNTKTRADDLHAYLVAQGLKVAKIHGDIPPRERKRIMNQVKNLDFEYIVATDLAARGIDIEGVSHVINDAIPQDLSFFVHRVGRTGRNGLPGVAITLYQPSDDSDIRELEKMGIRFVPKVLKNGVIEDTYDRDRRANREKKQEKLDIEMIGLVKKKKKKIKPGYKKKIKWAVDEKRRKAKRAENRARGRAERKAKRQTF